MESSQLLSSNINLCLTSFENSIPFLELLNESEKQEQRSELLEGVRLLVGAPSSTGEVTLVSRALQTMFTLKYITHDELQSFASAMRSVHTRVTTVTRN